jgi:short-subunit dehydrogenase
MTLPSISKTALITGASAGIGKVLSILLAKNGYKCILVARRNDKLQSTFEVISKYNNESFCITADLSRPESTSEILSILKKNQCKLDLLVLNAGQSMSTKNNPDAYNHLMTLNFIRNMELIHTLKPFLGKGSQIVGISSLASFIAGSYAGAYSASKAAFNKGLEALRREFFVDDIDISIICPGFIKTELTSVNNFDMPFLMELEDAGKKIYTAIKKRKKVYCFPWQLAMTLKIGLKLPIFIQDYLLRSTPHDKANSPQRNWNKIDLGKLD